MVKSFCLQFWQNIITIITLGLRQKDVTLYKTGERLFRDFGLISATTTLSCLLFKKDDFCIEVFNKFSKKSEVYSHSFSLLHMFYDKPCAFVSEPVLTYSQNTTEEEMYNFGKVYGERFAYYPFTAGLVDLIRVLSSGTNIEVDKILSFNEIEISPFISVYFIALDIILLNNLIKSFLSIE